MKKNLLLIILAVSIITILTGCGKNSKNNVVTIGTIASYGAIPDANVVKEINKYLEEQGCTYTVKYTSLPNKYIIDSSNNEYDCANDSSNEGLAQVIIDAVDSNNAPDICNVSTCIDKSYISAYEMLAKDGYLYALDDYLESDEGLELYNSLPKGKWEARKRYGHIYSISGNPYSVYTRPNYMVNKKILEKYGYTIEDINKPINELTDILERIQAEEGADKEFYSFLTSYYDLKCSWLKKVNNCVKSIAIDENDKIVSLLDDEDYVNILRDMYNAKNNEKIAGTTRDLVTLKADNFFLIMNFNGFMPTYSPIEIGALYDYKIYNKSQIKYNYYGTDEDYLYVYPYEGNIWFNSGDDALAIMKSSKNKEAALDYIKRIYTDPVLNNLLTLGIEGVDYYVENGIPMYPEENGYMHKTKPIYTFSSGFIGLPAGESRRNRDEIMKEREYDKGTSRYADYFWDSTDYYPTVKETNKIIDEMYELLRTDEDFDIFINGLKARLREAGIDELIESCQKDFDEWRSKN